MILRSFFRWLALLAIGCLLAVLASVLTGCALRYPPADGRFTPESPAPEASRIAALAQDGVMPPERQPWLRLSSPFVVAGNGVRLSCFVPRTTPNVRALRLRLADEASPLPTHAIEAHAIELLIESVPCGEYVASCEALTSLDPAHAQVVLRLTQPFTSRGSCTAAGDDR